MEVMMDYKQSGAVVEKKIHARRRMKMDLFNGILRIFSGTVSSYCVS
jgi:hypothetical protein